MRSGTEILTRSEKPVGMARRVDLEEDVDGEGTQEAVEADTAAVDKGMEDKMVVDKGTVDNKEADKMGTEGEVEDRVRVKLTEVDMASDANNNQHGIKWCQDKSEGNSLRLY